MQVEVAERTTGRANAGETRERVREAARVGRVTWTTHVSFERLLMSGGTSVIRLSASARVRSCLSAPGSPGGTRAIRLWPARNSRSVVSRRPADLLELVALDVELVQVARPRVDDPRGQMHEPAEGEVERAREGPRVHLLVLVGRLGLVELQRVRVVREELRHLLAAPPRVERCEELRLLRRRATARGRRIGAASIARGRAPAARRSDAAVMLYCTAKIPDIVPNSYRRSASCSSLQIPIGYARIRARHSRWRSSRPTRALRATARGSTGSPRPPRRRRTTMRSSRRRASSTTSTRRVRRATRPRRRRRVPRGDLGAIGGPGIPSSGSTATTRPPRAAARRATRSRHCCAGRSCPPTTTPRAP